ncbi:hypothetical protein M201_gp15 [Haloarcula californiae tailed virus 2]|uniref:Uncharacterized protein n=1 Tax=Haloarcula californiae tailed virus 2 TaxID=1273747 RepID=R4T7P1_9CAUD|nr:hypothetical protein M201_gp15 [Haloarcula californiae tailed virus 2]AGM11789.1 hypothetical protein HCTV2_14 [Haloarcula californiae tailed virus 2]
MILKMAEGHRTRPRARSRAVAHWQRTGCILPGTAGEVAAYRARSQEVQDRG